MNDRTVADLIVDRLETWGVSRVFGYSGDGINGFMGALRRAEDRVEFVQARHEETAAFMAVGHAKYTGGVGVVTSTQGPGAVHLLNGLYDAKLDGVPVVAIVGQQSRTVLGSAYMQEIELTVLFKDVAAQFVQQVNAPEQLPMVLDRAFRTAKATSSPCVVILPHDIQSAPAPELEQKHGVVVTAPSWSTSAKTPRTEDLDAAAAILNGSRKVALLVGQGARHAGAEVVAIAEQLGAGIATSLLGKPYVDETLPFAVGTMGHLGTTASAHLLGNCDALLIVGSNDPWTEFYPPPGAARAVQIDIDERKIGNRYPVEVGLAGDAAAALQALSSRLTARPGGQWRDDVEQEVLRWRALAEERAAVPARPVNPERVVRELNGRLPADAQVSIDVGSCVYWYARQLILPPGVPAHLSGTLASMGCSIPYGIAAKLARPDRPLVALAGDGAMQMAGIAELVTVAHRWRQWQDPRFIVCVFNNRELTEVTWEQRESEGEPRFRDSQELPDFPFAGYADLLGFTGIRVEDPELLADAWERAFAADRPVMIEVLTDPEVPLLPPFPGGKEKAESMRKALAGEDGGGRALDLLDTYTGQEERG
ncbi:thiamine pyrophosphate enzyme, N-terminal TPP binding domain protein [Pseudarthrobacter siccitolerans]|uniref:Thiamine pyrophosphate enzyme, N-terminal TPP binding domain protein n=1 Tax=Pseudarthrobacter siccitolerans TaxID=861266 RepID=A0A024H6D7_9MICC|nr:thiamine pyrophosphate-requiring protein [Pseudarthrobacter siccitolerans]CCQ47442.1 thiamine pyrophosphate enzyme, N-terminal TPP binding domain protein [Pseudarthrobacter siccitolerans]